MGSSPASRPPQDASIHGGPGPLQALPTFDGDARVYETLIRAHSELGDGVVVLSGERFLYVNDAFCRLVGYTREDLVDPGFFVGHLWAPHERERMRERMRRRLSGELPEDHYEVALAPLWGPEVHAEISVKPLPSSFGDLRLAVVRDVTERKRAQEELETARRHVAQSEKLATLGSLVSGVAHEVRTPLALIQNNLSLIGLRLEELARGEDPAASLERAKANLRAAEEGVDRVNRLVKDLARFTRLPAEPTRCRLEEVVAEALELWRVTHPGASAHVVEELEPTPSRMLDKSKIQQVVLNLLANSADALGHSGTISVGTRAIPGGACLFVADDGPGIPEEALGRIFEPFYTTKSDGMGFGLSIVRRIVELHRGTIRCESRVGSGTRFVIHLPG